MGIISGLLAAPCLATVQTNAGLLLIATIETNVDEI